MPKKKKTDKNTKKLSKKKIKKSSGKAKRKSLNIPKLTKSDYFRKATEFRVWLSESKNLYLDELDSKNTKDKYYKRFMKKWNNGQLAVKFYSGLNSCSIDVPTTRHSWNFKLSGKDKNDLTLIKDSVDTETNCNKNANQISYQKPFNAKFSNNGGNFYKKNETQAERADRRLEQRTVNRYERKKWKREINENLDEIAPRAMKGTKESMLEKKREKRASNRQMAAKDDGVEVNDSFLMGGGGSDFQQRLQRRRQFKARKGAEASEKLQKFNEEERKKVEYFKNLMNKNK